MFVILAVISRLINNDDDIQIEIICPCCFLTGIKPGRFLECFEWWGEAGDLNWENPSNNLYTKISSQHFQGGVKHSLRKKKTNPVELLFYISVIFLDLYYKLEFQLQIFDSSY